MLLSQAPTSSLTLGSPASLSIFQLYIKHKSWAQQTRLETKTSDQDWWPSHTQVHTRAHTHKLIFPGSLWTCCFFWLKCFCLCITMAQCLIVKDLLDPSPKKSPTLAPWALWYTPCFHLPGPYYSEVLLFILHYQLDPPYLWNEKRRKRLQMNLFSEQKQTHRFWKTYGPQRGQFGGRMDRGCGIGRCTLWYMEWLANGDLLYSTGNSTQYSVMICVGKESKREWMCVHVWLNHFVLWQKLSQPCKLTIFQ